MKKHTAGLFTAIGLMLMTLTANAAVIEFDVDAKANSSTGGIGLDTGLTYNAGDTISGFVNASDLWNAGPLPRWSNADGLITDLFATESDDSAEAEGTKIGQAFSDYTQDGFTFAYGTLVGKINSTYFELGTSFDVVSTEAGALSLYYWDSNNSDNTEFVTVNITSAVPEPSTIALFALGTIGLIGFTRLRSRQV